jgi:HSP90 family molecular chaperone
MVDSEDLPLNVSRELLQKSRVLSIISKRLVRKALDMFTELQKDEEKFATFSKNFGRYIKVGVIEDKDNKDALLKLATFESSGSEERGATLPEYVSRMKEGQKQIYYLSGSSKAAAAASPVLERLNKQGYEVLYALDQIDEIALQGVGKFGEFDVIDAAKENVDLGELSEDEKEASEVAKLELNATTAFLKDVLGTMVDKVEVSTRLTSSPSALVQPQWGMSPQMQRFMKAQAAAAGSEDMMGGMGGMANLEINPTHSAVKALQQKVADEKDAAATRDFAELLYDVAAVSSGYEVKDPAAFAKRVVKLMSGDDAGDDEEPTPAEAPADEEEPTPAEAPVAEASGAGEDDQDEEVITPEVM